MESARIIFCSCMARTQINTQEDGFIEISIENLIIQ